MEEKNVLICLERLDIGGVETAVLNQVSRLLELGNRVIILAKNGIYTKVLEERGAICQEFEFALEDNFNKEKVEELIKIIEKEKINEVHIHQFPCILSMFPACLITNIPYIAYTHIGVEGIYEWFMTTFPVYRIAIPYYYQYAYKIVTITEDLKQDIINRFSILEDKIKVIPNSISFSEADKIRTPKQNQLKDFLMISRFSKEKEKSIYNGIDLFTCYTKQNEQATLKIIGDGNLRQEVEAYIKEKKLEEKTIFLGAVNNVLEQINQSDVVLGVDRCILEAITMKKIAIMIGYEHLKPQVTIDNIEQASKGNFSGRNLKDETMDALVEQLTKLDSSKIEDITQKNYDYAKQNLNIENNFYTIPVHDEILQRASVGLLEMFIQIQEKQSETIENLKEFKGMNEKLKQELEVQTQKTQQKENENLQKQLEIEKKQQELDKIYHSKRWKYFDKFLNFMR